MRILSRGLTKINSAAEKVIALSKSSKIVRRLRQNPTIFLRLQPQLKFPPLRSRKEAPEPILKIVCSIISHVFEPMIGANASALQAREKIKDTISSMLIDDDSVVCLDIRLPDIESDAIGVRRRSINRAEITFTRSLIRKSLVVSDETTISDSTVLALAIFAQMATSVLRKSFTHHRDEFYGHFFSYVPRRAGKVPDTGGVALYVTLMEPLLYIAVGQKSADFEPAIRYGRFRTAAQQRLTGNIQELAKPGS